VGSTLYADRGPPFGLPELYGDGAKRCECFVSLQQVRNVVAIRLEPYHSDVRLFPWSPTSAFQPEATRGAEKGDAA
jgi:hypothetical protein